MKKSSFAALVLGTVSAVLFSLGMCMALISEWNAMNQGIILGTAGIIVGIITVIIWRKMENKPPLRMSGKTLGVIFVSLLGALLFGVGMCLCMVWNNIVYGVIIGLAGMVILLMLIPMCKGLK